MPILTDIHLVMREPAIVDINLSPATSIGGKNIEFVIQKRRGGEPILRKSLNSGYAGGESGLTILNSGQGKFRLKINGADTSGWKWSVYPHEARIVSGGGWSVVSQGDVVLHPAGE